jgi:putative ABC transport system ATP-binding protein
MPGDRIDGDTRHHGTRADSALAATRRGQTTPATAITDDGFRQDAQINLCNDSLVPCGSLFPPTRAAMPPPATSTEAIPAGTESSSTPVLLQARQLGFVVDGHSLWHDLALTLRAGERLAVAGASGSGKTLLLRTLAGLEPVQTGELIFHERPLSDWWMPAYRARVVYVPQRPALAEGRVEAALRVPFQFRVHRQQRFPSDRALELLAMLGRDKKFLQQRTERLSGGEAQIVAMLRALLTGPEVLLLDEPTASLDSGAVAAIEQLVASWMGEQRQRACLWTSHDRQQLERVSDRTLSLEARA